VSALFGEKNFGFYEIYDVSAQTSRGDDLIQCGQGGGVNFFVDVFYGRPLVQSVSIEINIKLNFL